MTRTYKKRKILENQHEQSQPVIDPEETATERHRLKCHWLEVSKKLKQQLKSGDAKTIFHLAQLFPKSEYPIQFTTAPIIPSAMVKVEQILVTSPTPQVSTSSASAPVVTTEKSSTKEMKQPETSLSVTKDVKVEILSILSKPSAVASHQNATILAKSNYKSKQYRGAHHCVMCHDNFDRNSSTACIINHDYTPKSPSSDDDNEEEKVKGNRFYCMRCSSNKTECDKTGAILEEDFDRCYNGPHLLTRYEARCANVNCYEYGNYDIYHTPCEYSGCGLADDHDRGYDDEMVDRFVHGYSDNYHHYDRDDYS
jgi:hypothetical protein